jgi:hypothetical protein
MNRPWSEEEDAVVVQWAGIRSARTIGEMIGRTKKSVSSRINQKGLPRIPCGHTSSIQKPWSDEELKAIRGCKTVTQAIAACPGRTDNSIRHLAYRIGVKFDRKVYDRRALSAAKVGKHVSVKPTPIEIPHKASAPLEPLEHCPECGCAVFPWSDHYKRLLHRRMSNVLHTI